MEDGVQPLLDLLQVAEGKQPFIGQTAGGVVSGQHGVGRRVSQVREHMDLGVHVALPQCGQGLIAGAAEADNGITI